MTSDYENPWIFDGKPFTDDDIGKSVGFVYLITNLITGKKYLGRKYFESIKKPRITKKTKSTRRVRSSSDWKSYYGSSEILLEQLKEHGPSNFKREIISLHKTRGDVNTAEVREQFARNVLEDETYINANIAGRWHRPPKHIIEARRYKRE